jgi:hypothetical protein
VGVENEWGPVLMVRAGHEKDGGMSIPLRTGLEKDDICYEQRAWESRTSGVQLCWWAPEWRKTGVCLFNCARESRKITFAMSKMCGR